MEFVKPFFKTRNCSDVRTHEDKLLKDGFIRRVRKDSIARKLLKLLRVSSDDLVHCFFDITGNQFTQYEKIYTLYDFSNISC